MLAKELSLQTECGYIELVRLSEDEGWMVYDVIYGIPLFADKVAKQVLENMKTFELLHTENIAKVQRRTRNSGLIVNNSFFPPLSTRRMRLHCQTVLLNLLENCTWLGSCRFLHRNCQFR
jgi:hypothetical protein